MSQKVFLVGGACLACAALIVGAILWSGVEDPAPDSGEQAVQAPTQPARLSGTVVDAADRPIPEATVRARLGDEVARATSDEQGRFTLEGLSPGAWRVDAQAKGFVALGPESVSSTLLNVSPGQEVSDVFLALARPVRVRGIVVAGARPVEGARLSVFYQSVQGALRGAEPFVLDDVGRTGADGTFSLEGPPGTFRVMANAQGHPFTQARALTLDAGAQRDNLRIDLSGSAQLTFSVRDAQGALIASDVTVRGRGMEPIRARTVAGQPLVIEGVSPGRVRIEVSAQGYASARLERAVEGAQRLPIEVQLRAAQGVFGRVVFPSSEPSFQRAGVELLDNDMAFVGRLRVKQGRFGGAKVSDKARFARAVSPFFGASEPTPITQDEEMVLTLGAGGRVHGRVKRGSGQAVASYRIEVDSVVPATRSVFGGRTIPPQIIQSPDGAFSFDALAPGIYTLLATPMVPGLAPARSAPIRVGASTTTGPVVLTVTAGARINGVVRAQGQPVEGALVRVVPQGRRRGSRAPRATTDALGRYTLETVGPGIQSIMVSGKGYMTQEASGLRVPSQGTLTRDIDLERAQPGARFAFHGIGATLKRTDEGVVIQQVMDGMPASTFGLKPKDLITSVDGEDVLEMPLQDVIKLIRGEQGVGVAIEVERPGEGLVSVDVERGRVVVKDRRGRKRRRAKTKK